MGTIEITQDEYTRLINTNQKYETLIASIVDATKYIITDWEGENGNHYHSESFVIDDDEVVLTTLKLLDRKGYEALYDAKHQEALKELEEKGKE